MKNSLIKEQLTNSRKRFISFAYYSVEEADSSVPDQHA